MVFEKDLNDRRGKLCRCVGKKHFLVQVAETE